MPDVILADLVGEWAHDQKWAVACLGRRIEYPCACGSSVRYAYIDDNHVALARAECSCDGCTRTEVIASNPDFFDMLKESITSRIDHKSIVVSNYVRAGDDIQHAVDHFKATQKIYLTSGKFMNEQVDLKNSTLVIDSDVQGCSFENIKNPIQVNTSDKNIVISDCNFEMSPQSIYFNTLPYI